MAKEVVSKNYAVSRMYKDFAIENDFIPQDNVLSFWQGKEPGNDGAYSAARRNLKKEGFVFEQVANGWIVKKRPVIGLDFVKANFTKDQERLMGRIIAEAVSRITGTEYVDKNGILVEKKVG
jgi:hypothetical protein